MFYEQILKYVMMQLCDYLKFQVVVTAAGSEH